MTSDKNTQISSINHVDYDDPFKKREKSSTTTPLDQESVHITDSQRIDPKNLPMIESNHCYTPTKARMQPSIGDVMTENEPTAATAVSQSLNTHTSPLKGFGGTLPGQGNLNPPLSQAKKATKFEIISVQELDADEIDDGEESGEDAEDSTSELQSNQSRGSTCDDGSVLKQNGSRSLVNNNLQSVSITNPDAGLSRQSMPMVLEVTSTPSAVNSNFPSISSNGETIPQLSQKIGHVTGSAGFVYGRTDSGEIFLPMSSTLNNSSGVNFVDCSNQVIQPGINSELMTVFRQHAQGQMNAATGGSILSQQPAVSALNPIISQNQGHLNAQHSTLNSALGAYNIGAQAAVTTNPILPSRFRVVKKVKPFVGKRGRWDCRDVPCDVKMTSVGHSRSNPQTAGPLPQNPNPVHASLQHNIGLSVNSNAADQLCNNSGAALSKASQQVASNYNTSFALTEDISGSTKNPVHVPLVSHVSSQRGVDVGQAFKPIRDANVVGEQVGVGNFPIAALDEALSSVTTTSDPIGAGRQVTDEHSDSVTTTGGGGTYNSVPFLSSSENFNSNWARRSSTAE